MIIKNVYASEQIGDKLIRRMGNCIGLAFVSGFVFNEIVGTVLAFTLGTEIFSNQGFIWIYQILFSAIIFTVPFMIIAKPMNVRLSRVCNFAKPKKDITLPIIFIGMAVCMLANVLGTMAVTVLENLGLSDINSSLDIDTSSPLLVGAGLIAGSVLPGLVEEFALRGVVMGSLRRFGNRFAIIISAILFGLMHGTLAQAPFAFVVGLYLGFAAIKTGSVYTAVIIHTLNNLFAFLLDILMGDMTTNTQTITSGIYFMVCIILGFVGIYMLKDNKNVFRFKKADIMKEKTLMQKIGIFFSSPGIIGLLVYIVLQFASVKIMEVLV